MAAAAYLEDAGRQFHGQKKFAEKALAQVSDEEFFHRIDAGSNSLALIVKHLAGNMRSRWTDFLTSDGEKADRRRDSEFETEEADTRAALMERWEEGWRCVFDAVDALTPGQLLTTIVIRGEPHTVLKAINRHTLRSPHRTDRLSGQAPRGAALADALDPEGPVGRVGEEANSLSPWERVGVRGRLFAEALIRGFCFPLTLAGRSLREARPSVAAGA
jgi:hypothetical protein